MATKKITIELEVPEDLALLLERVPWLRRVVAVEGISGLLRRLELQAQLDVLTPEPKSSEEDILEADSIIKRAIARRLENELSGGIPEGSS